MTLNAVSNTPPITWQPLERLVRNFEANLAAMGPHHGALRARLRDHQPRQPWHLSAAGGAVVLGKGEGTDITALPHVITPAAATRLIQQAFPQKSCEQPFLVAGLDQGWFWNALYQLPCNIPALPGFRPPLFLLAGDLDRLWAVMHFQRWDTLLADERVILFAGPDALQQAAEQMRENPGIPWPRMSITVESALWTPHAALEDLLQSLQEEWSSRVEQMQQTMAQQYQWASAPALAERFGKGGKLRILGLTSRYTTFLQHSMRDWLDAFERLGHETLLLIEQRDHELLTNTAYTGAALGFQPDLIVAIDHYRGEMVGLPTQVPFVMWVQDMPPNLDRPEAGAAQGPLDYCLGFGRLLHARRHGYPAERYMPATVGVNDRRFAARAPAAREEFACDVSFVSHASVPAEQLVQEQMQNADTNSGRVLTDVFEQLRAIYRDGQSIVQPLRIRQMLRASAERHGCAADSPCVDQLLDFFTHKVNNALFRHQALHWMRELDLNLHLYGRGWENHPTLGRYARGVADNQSQLADIFRASRINLQITPFGAVHQRLFEGLCAGGFFLLREVPGDRIEPIYRDIYRWCLEHDVTCTGQLLAVTDPQVQRWIAAAQALTGVDYREHEFDLMETLRLSHDGEYIRSSSAVWPEQMDAVSFHSAESMQRKIAHYLACPEERRSIAEAMRAVVLERFTYVGVTQRLLNFIAEDLDRRATHTEAA